ncbi:hypothetical protein MH117_10375 [Paenibacillus sp. ACRRX]|uniref:hypothetical protein n=1 Tax=Paenibacillus sp. ACRRX TaxID=2918206 RepID=UPI001EF5C65F|nr:hypothetical protein [Paenibacillus sp. ACRRX]MCG7407828.1 hypothetical protein [Paenibacillus sp. ACRRX]
MNQEQHPHRRIKRHRVRTSWDRTYEAEAAQELTAPSITRDVSRFGDVTKVDRNSGLGYAAIVFAVVSLFIFPIIMGITSFALGLIAYLQGSRTAGITAAVIGLAAFTFRLLMVT